MKEMKGLTLIEVLVSLAIVAIALTAVIKATTQTIRSTQYLESKTVSTWVANLILNEAKLGLLPLPTSSANTLAKTEMLGSEWYWQIHATPTPNKRIKKIIVQVYDQSPSEDDITPITQIEGYVYANSK